MLSHTARLCAVSAAVILALAPLAAQAEWRRIARLSPEQWSAVRQTLSQRGRLAPLMDRYIPYFSVPAQENRVLVCEHRGLPGLDCWVESRGSVCPSSVEVRIQGVPTPAQVPVTCIGPDATGTCECDFTPQ